MIAILTFATAPAKPFNVVAGNAAGLTWNPAAKDFEAAPTGTYTTAPIAYQSGLLANRFVVAIPNLPVVANDGDVILFYLDAATNLDIASPSIIPPSPTPGPSSPVVSVVVQGV